MRILVPMRVLVLTWEYPPHVAGGLGKHVAELTPALARRDVEVHLVTPVPGVHHSVEVSEGATIHRVGVAGEHGECPTFFTEVLQVNAALENECKRLIERSGPFDLIHSHDWLTSFAGISLKNASKLPLLATIHATERGRGRGYLRSDLSHRINDAEWRLAYEAWRVICCAHHMAREIHSYFGTPLDKIDVIPNGVDPSRFQALDRRDLGNFRASYAPDDDAIVLYVGRIVQEKGAQVLVRSVPLVLAQAPQTRFIIAGKGPDLQRIRQLVGQMGLSDSVLVPGFITDEDRDRLYKVADCAVFPSLYEPFGIVALEAMAARTPVVVSEVGGLREVVKHAETGITIYPNNPESCAWGILHTLQHPEWTRQRVENAYNMVLTTYNWDAIAGQTVDVYQRVIDERARTEW